MFKSINLFNGFINGQFDVPIPFCWFWRFLWVDGELGFYDKDRENPIWILDSDGFSRYDQGFKMRDDDPTWCRDCRLFMTFDGTTGFDDVIYEEWRCLKCSKVIHVEVLSDPFHPDSYEDDYYERDEYDLAMSECSQYWHDGMIYCGQVGSEHCDWDCRFSKDIGKTKQDFDDEIAELLDSDE